MSFSKDLAKFAKKTNTSIPKILRIVAVATFPAIIIRTPVMTGRARANWQYSTTSPAGGIVEDTNKKNIESEIKNGHTHILTNNLPYIEPLENGSSTQAPSGMVKVSTAEFEANLSKAVRSL
jgi:hypothetical protein